MSTDPGTDLRCERVRLLLSLSADGAATAVQEVEIAQHLPACADCRAARAVDLAVRARCSARALVPEGFAARVGAAAVRQRLEARAQNRFLVSAAAAAVLVAAVTFAALDRDGTRPGPATGPDAPRVTAGRALRAGLALERLEDR